MRPILFQWRTLTIWSYPALLYVGLLTGVVAGNVAAHIAGIDAFRVFVAMLVLIALGLTGARLMYVASNWRFYRQNYRLIWHRNRAGAVQYGALLLALPFSVFLLHALRLPLGVFWDVGAFTMLIIMMFGRIGCLLNGCCAGRPASGWGTFYLPNLMGVWDRRVPTQCLESGWCALLLAAAVAIWRYLPFPGALFLLVSAGYGGGRLVMEFGRELPSGASRLTINHAISLVIVVASLATLLAHWPK
ncbi:MAG TPA: prolipoprotein diacylglyceryl transferase family protein [Terriglobales bacterium]|jgi:phosphatidylglycerol:prolipoprotein diacylglycerol transferase|nr:prolipoprotein diacylglyceryl transferase family protein [Terriglobales bacterium]